LALAPDAAEPLLALPVEIEHVDDGGTSIVTSNALPAVGYPAPDEMYAGATRKRRPRPGFWEAVLWTIVYGGVLQIALGIGCALVAVVIVMLASGNPGAVLAHLRAPGFQRSAEFQDIEYLGQVFTLVAFPVVGAALGFLLIRLTSGRDWRRRIGLRKPAAIHVLLAVLGLPALAILSEGVHEVALWSGMPSFNYQEELNRWIDGLPIFFAVLVIAVGPAFAEELWCRGFLGRGLVARFGVVGGVLLTSLFFGVMHLDPPHIVATFCMGVCLHLAYLASRSLWISMLLHFLNNLLAVLTVTVLKRTAVARAADAPDVVHYVAALVLGAAVAWAFYRSRVRMVTETGWRPDFPGAEWPPAESGQSAAHSNPGWRSWLFVVLAVVLLICAIWGPLRGGESQIITS
jgi:membrane protease YdiL (CAAX protease family)